MFLVLWALLACRGPRPPAPPPPQPRLVVLLVIDQLPAWSFAAKRAEASAGFARILEGGRRFTARYPYAATTTAPGHATLATGAPPAVTGIIGNEWWRRELGREAKVAEPPGGGAPSAAMLRVDGVADVLARERPAARAVAISLKDRSALLPLGHAGLSIWYSDDCACLVANGDAPWLEALPPVTPRLATPWVPLDETRLEQLSGGPDDAPGEVGIAGWDATFPHDFAEATEPTHAVMDAPLGNDLIVEAAIAAIDAERLGADDAADYLVLSFSAHDYVGHAWGQDSWEAWDTWLRLDARIDELVRALDERVGVDRWAVVVSADHGAPELAARQGIPAYRISDEDLAREAEAAAASVAGPGDWIASARFPTVFLTDAAHARPDRAAILDAVVAAIGGLAGVERADLTSALAGDCDARADDAARALCLSIDPERSGEVFYVPAAGTTLDQAPSRDAVSHGSLRDDDREVPLVVYAPGVAPGDAGEVSALQIAPTIATLLGVSAPPAAREPSVLARP